MSHPAARPWRELARKQPDGNWRIYATVYRRPLCIFILGHWVWGRRHLRVQGFGS